MKTDLAAKELHYKLQRNQKIWDDHTCILEVTETLQRAEARGRQQVIDEYNREKL